MENRLRVLLLDVEKSYLRILAPGLHDELEFDVSVAKSGHEAVEMMKTSTSYSRNAREASVPCIKGAGRREGG